MKAGKKKSLMAAGLFSLLYSDSFSSSMLQSTLDSYSAGSRLTPFLWHGQRKDLGLAQGDLLSQTQIPALSSF